MAGGGAAAPGAGPASRDPRPGFVRQAWSRLRAGLRTPYGRWLAAILLVGGVVQVWAALQQWTQFDEGMYLEGALLVARGQVPVVSFAGREPLLLYYLALGVEVAGPSLVVARLQMVLVNVVTAAVLAQLGRRLARGQGARVGLVTAAIYLVTPFLAWVGTTLLLEPLSDLFLALTLYFALRARWAPARWNLPVAGVALAFAFLARRDAFVVGLPVLAFLAWESSSWRERVLNGVRFLVPAAVITGGVLAALAALSTPQWVGVEFGTGYQQVNQPSFPALVVAGLPGYALLTGAAVFLVPFLIPLEVWGRKAGFGVRLGLTYLTVAILAAFVAAFLVDPQWGTAADLGPMVPWLALPLAALGLLFLARVHLRGAAPFLLEDRAALLLLTSGLVMLVVDLVVRPEAFVYYLLDAAPGFTLLSGAAVVTLAVPPAPATRRVAAPPSPTGPGSPRRASRARVLEWPAVACVVLLGVSGFGTALLFSPANPANQPFPGAYGNNPFQRMYSAAQVDEVSDYLRTHVPADQAIFSFDDIFLAQAGRVSTPDLGLAVDLYLDGGLNNSQSPYPYDPLGLAPSPSGLLAEWNASHLAWVVDGYGTAYIAGALPLVGWYFDTYYTPVATFGDTFYAVQLLQRVPTPTNATASTVLQVRSLPGISALAEDPGSGTLYAGSLGSSEVQVVQASGTTTNLTLPGIGGVRSLAVDLGDLWAGSASGPFLDVVNLSTDAVDRLDVGNASGGFAFDGPARMAYLAGGATRTLVGLQGPNWTVRWNDSYPNEPTHPIYVASSGSLYVASAYGRSVVAVDPLDGWIGESLSLPESPYSLAFSQGYLYASTSITGNLYQIDPATETTVGVVPLGGGSQALASGWGGSLLGATLEVGGGVELFNASTLTNVGTIPGGSCSRGLVWGPGPRTVWVTNPCQGTFMEVHLPTPTWISVEAPVGTEVSAGGHPLPLGSLLPYWAPLLSLVIEAPGREATTLSVPVHVGPGTLALDLPLGPTTAGVADLSLGQVALAAVASVLGALAGVWLLRADLDELPPGPRRDP